MDEQNNQMGEGQSAEPQQPASPQPQSPDATGNQPDWQPVDQQPKQAYLNGVPIETDKTQAGQPQQPNSPYGAPQPAQPQQAPQPVSPYGQPQPYYQPSAPASSGKATGALVCGIFAIVFSFLPLVGIALGIIALVLAGKAIKEAGKSGKTTGGKVCGIIGIVLSVLMFILSIVVGIGAAVLTATDYGNTSYSYSSNSSSLPHEFDSQSSSDSAATDTERALESVASNQLDKLKNKDATFMKWLADEFDAEMEKATDYSLADMGIDPASFADWMLTDFDYQLDGAYDNGDGTGTVFADVTMRDVNEFSNTFLTDAQAAIDAGEFDALDEAGATAHLGDIYRAAMDKSTAMSDGYVSIETVDKNGTWMVDEDQWNDQLEIMFWLY